MVTFATRPYPTNAEDGMPEVERADVKVEPVVLSSDVVEPIWVCNHTQANQLGVALHVFGFTAVVYCEDQWKLTPTIWVKRDENELFIHVGPGSDGEWWFWSPQLKPIAKISEVSKAADEILRAFDTASGKEQKMGLSPIG